MTTRAIYNGALRLVAEYTGPLMRVRLPDGRAVDVYPDDEEPPQGAVRRSDLARLAANGKVTLLHMCEQNASGLMPPRSAS